MALAEGAAGAILTRQTHRIPLYGKRAEGQRLGGGPVKALTGFKHPGLGL